MIIRKKVTKKLNTVKVKLNSQFKTLLKKLETIKKR